MKPALTNYQIKLLAAILMAIDHVGAVLFPQIHTFRAIGRLSFPLFAWLLIEGEAHTRSVWRYGLRLLVLGLISQPIFMLTFETQGLNILFTLLIGLVGLRAARISPETQMLTWIGTALLAQLLDTDYGAYGIAAIALIWQFQPTLLWWACWLLPHLLLFLLMPEYGEFQLPVVIAPLIFQATNHQLGAKARWFYLFYPLHLAGIYLINLWMGGTSFPLSHHG
jgi:hypothetical protein